MRFVVNILRTSRVENPSFYSHEPDWVFYMESMLIEVLAIVTW